MSEPYALPADFEAVSTPLEGLALCEARLMNDARFVWVVLIPRRAGVVEIDDLVGIEQGQLFREAIDAGRRVRAMGEALGRVVEKLNIAQLGNVTRALHVHIIGRREDDAAWPNPVWGVGEADPWSEEQRQVLEKAWAGA